MARSNPEPALRREAGDRLIRQRPVGKWPVLLRMAARWKVTDWTVGVTGYIAALDVAEFALWCGPALAVLAVAGVGRCVRPADTGRRGVDAVGRGLLAIVLVLAVCGHTAGEVGRLWLFLVPFVAVIGAHAIAQEGSRRLPWVVALQLVTTLVLKSRADFF